MSLTPDGMMLFVVNYQGMAVSIYNAIHFNRIKTVNLPAGPMNVAVSPDGSAALVTVTSASSVALIRVKKTQAAYAQAAPVSSVVPGGAPYAQTAQAITSPAVPASLLPPSNYIPQPFGKVASVYTGKGPTAEAITPDGKYLYVINTQDSTLSVIDVAGDKVVKTIKVGKYPTAVSVSPDGHYCFVVNSSSDMWTTRRPAQNAARFSCRASRLCSAEKERFLRCICA